MCNIEILWLNIGTQGWYIIFYNTMVTTSGLGCERQVCVCVSVIWLKYWSYHRFSANFYIKQHLQNNPPSHKPCRRFLFWKSCLDWGWSWWWLPMLYCCVPIMLTWKERPQSYDTEEEPRHRHGHRAAAKLLQETFLWFSIVYLHNFAGGVEESWLLVTEHFIFNRLPVKNRLTFFDHIWLFGPFWWIMAAVVEIGLFRCLLLLPFRHHGLGFGINDFLLDRIESHITDRSFCTGRLLCSPICHFEDNLNIQCVVPSVSLTLRYSTREPRQKSGIHISRPDVLWSFLWLYEARLLPKGELY